jgi:two-component SAPR family response regulator
MYKKGLDQIPKQFKNLRMKIMKNVGHSCLKIGKFNDAVQAYEEIMENQPDHSICFNLFLC